MATRASYTQQTHVDSLEALFLVEQEAANLPQSGVDSGEVPPAPMPPRERQEEPPPAEEGPAPEAAAAEEPPTTPEPEPAQTQAAAPAPAPSPEAPPAARTAPQPATGGGIAGSATHYGASFNGRPLGCGGIYSSNDPSILAVSPALYSAWPCGTQVQICGPAGCIVAVRQDACPGCAANVFDLSEAGNAAVCGSPPHTCRVTVNVLN